MKNFKKSPNKEKPCRNYAKKKKLSKKISDIKIIKKTKESSFIP